MMSTKSISGVNAMKANKGFTLLEVAVVLAVIAILAAMLTPIVTSYIDQARVTRANNDVKKIAEAVNLYKRDTGLYPGFSTLVDARTTQAPAFTTSLVTCMVSGPSTGAALGGTFSGCSTNVGFLDAFLNVNSIGFSTSSTEAVGGRALFRGPYLDGLSSSVDPWGTPYVVNSGNLSATSANHVFALSAGPNATFDTTMNQTGAVTFSSDDIGSLIK